MPSALILYQYFYPDDVVSSVLFTELAESLVERGWTVTALPCNRSFRDESPYPRSDSHHCISIERVWRPPFRQSSTIGRLLNCAWMVAAWSLAALRHKPDVLIIGTDPAMSAVSALAWKSLRPETLIAHWCFDLYPEAAISDGILKPGVILRALIRLMACAYSRVDLLADIGDCMRARLAKYHTSAKRVTLPTWALAEPSFVLPIEEDQRESLFKSAKIGLLYSGSFGRAHSYSELLTIARYMRGVDAHFSLAMTGNRVEEVRRAVRTGDVNVSFAPLVPQEQLKSRLSAADIHIVSLHEEWTGTVVPSKFFGAIAAGRPVLFIGSEESYLARLIRRHGLGWVCSPGSERLVAEELAGICATPGCLRDLQRHCHRVYKTEFSRERITSAFDVELRNLLAVNHKRELSPVRV